MTTADVGVRTAGRYPLADVTYGDEEIAAVVRTLRGGRTTCGPEVALFEDAVAHRVGTAHAVMVNSGSSADLLAVHALGTPDPGDEILVPAVTWPTQVWSCVQAGWTVRLVDVDPDTLQFDLSDLESKVNAHTRAVFPVHVMGCVGDMTGLMRVAARANLGLIEDCCEAFGARWHGSPVGSFGRAGAFSFFFSHVVSTMEGGMVATNDLLVDQSCRLWRSHGWQPLPDEHFHFVTWGMNLRPTEVQGTFGTAQLARFDGFRRQRSDNAATLRAATEGRYPGWLRSARVLDDCTPSWHGFPLLVQPDAPFTRKFLCSYLETHGIETRPLVAGNLARQPAFRNHPRVLAGPLPGADLLQEQAFYIGLSSLDGQGAAYVAEQVRTFCETLGAGVAA